MAYTEFYDDLQDLNEIDWDVIRGHYWSDTQEDGDRKRRRQAEFLVRHQFPFSLVSEIIVRTESARKLVEKMLDENGYNPDDLSP